MEVDSHSLIIITASTYVSLSCDRCVCLVARSCSYGGHYEGLVRSLYSQLYIPERETGRALEREGRVMFPWQPH